MVKGLETIIIPGNFLTVGIVVIFLSLLFFFQRYPSDRKAFGPIMTIWFTINISFGMKEIMQHVDILTALNPIMLMIC
jgi:KUP system potassium uptake protein